jgi:uncharacterized protein (TIGR02145 family)
MRVLVLTFSDMSRLLAFIACLILLLPTSAQDECFNPDLSNDGIVGSADLLLLLSYYDLAWPLDTSVSCESSVEHQSYTYNVVQIGDQCWFAENLRAELYINGDSIPSLLNNYSWTTTLEGATSVYGDGSFINTSCSYYSTAGSWVCDETQSLAVFGRLYNWYAVADARGLCPSGWHVPSNVESSGLESFVMQQGFGTTAGSALKTTSGWDDEGNGIDAFGFALHPAGTRNHFAGNFSQAERYGYWWTSTQSGSQAYARYCAYDSSEMEQSTLYARNGLSIRCVKDQ